MAKRIIRLAGIGGGPDGVLLDNKKRIVKIGSGEGNDVIIDSPYVSSNHCEIKQPRFLPPSVVDLGSKEGTFVNGIKVGKWLATSLTHGSFLSIGPLSYVIWYERNKGGD